MNGQKIDEAIAKTMLRDLPMMTVKEHHAYCVGILACCYEHVPSHLQFAIVESLQSIRKMGMNIDVEKFLSERQRINN